MNTLTARLETDRFVVVECTRFCVNYDIFVKVMTLFRVTTKQGCWRGLDSKNTGVTQAHSAGANHMFLLF